VSSTRTGDTATKPSGGGVDTVTGTLGVSVTIGAPNPGSAVRFAVTASFGIGAVETTGISMRSGSVGCLEFGGMAHGPGNWDPDGTA
jgi:hypothetical protein